MKPFRRIIVVLLSSAALIGAFVLVSTRCPMHGLALSRSMRASVRLKNRTVLPERADFDERVTLAALLQPGDDSTRWSESRAAGVQGYAVDIRKGGIEAANCYSMTTRDIHVDIALSQNAPPQERVVLEITPRMQLWAERQGWDWSEATLRKTLLGRWCYFEGWLFFDSEHAKDSVNTAPGGSGNWRATAWELHPVSYLKLVN